MATADSCPFVLYTTLSGAAPLIARPPDVAPECALLYGYGDAGSSTSLGWTRIQAEALTPAAHRALSGRAQSRILKIRSHLLNETRPLVFADSKFRLRTDAAGLREAFAKMRACNVSFLAYLHPQRPHALWKEFQAIRTSGRTTNKAALLRQERQARLDEGLRASDKQGKTVVIHGALILRLPGAGTREVEDAWWRAYVDGSDRDQPAFTMAYHGLFGGRNASVCGNGPVWAVQSPRTLGLPDFGGGWTFAKPSGGNVDTARGPMYAETVKGVKRYAVPGFCGTSKEDRVVSSKDAMCWADPEFQSQERSLHQCALRCAKCGNAGTAADGVCRYASFSAKLHDCTLYSHCDLKRVMNSSKREGSYHSIDVNELHAKKLAAQAVV